MPNPLFLLLPVILAATRSLAFAIQPPGGSAERSTLSAETEYQFLVIAVFSLTGLLVYLLLMIRFPDLGDTIAQLDQF